MKKVLESILIATIITVILAILITLGIVLFNYMIRLFAFNLYLGLAVSVLTIIGAVAIGVYNADED